MRITWGHQAAELNRLRSLAKGRKDTIEALRARAESAEAKLKVAVEALDAAESCLVCAPIADCAEVALTSYKIISQALAKIGGDDE